jgi:hypothetical protein
MTKVAIMGVDVLIASKLVKADATGGVGRMIGG